MVLQWKEPSALEQFEKYAVSSNRLRSLFVVVVVVVVDDFLVYTINSDCFHTSI